MLSNEFTKEYQVIDLKHQTDFRQILLHDILTKFLSNFRGNCEKS